MKNNIAPTIEEWADAAKYHLSYALAQCGCSGFFEITTDKIEIDLITLKVTDNNFGLWFAIPISLERLATDRVSFGELALLMLRQREDIMRGREKKFAIYHNEAIERLGYTK